MLNRINTLCVVPPLLTVMEVSKLLRIHRPKVYDLIHDKTLDGFKIGADWRIRTASVETLIGKLTVEMLKNR